MIQHSHQINATMRGVLVVSTVSNLMVGSTGGRRKFRKGEELGEKVAVKLA